MHSLNPYSNRYNLKKLTKYYSSLEKFIILNPAGEETIDFSSSEAVFTLNKAMLLADFKLKDYQLPSGYLIPPVPGRLDYLLHIQDFLMEKFNCRIDDRLNGLDIGSGANGIYCILGVQHFNWKMVGSETDLKAVEIANVNLELTKELCDNIEIRHQENKSFLFKNTIQAKEKFDFVVCNPPFHGSKEDAIKGSLKKLKNLGGIATKDEFSLNFEGQANELWCNGGEVLFIKRLIKESVGYKNQVKVFSSLVAKSESIKAIKKQLNKVKADFQVIPMALGNKKGRYVMWWFETTNNC
ncbi:23S rRNA (adenine(1618)-N(6))-methyltransferase RlmF [Flavobacteriaceae bacterium]|nr:23S rRNA (adenine(1618)-N(6))-methyltransferase RlmF [Flavobacteriaceae bacterium]